MSEHVDAWVWCPRCGQANPQTVLACQVCGLIRDPAAVVPPAPTVHPPGRGRHTAWIVAAAATVLVLLVTVAVVVLVGDRMRSGAPDPWEQVDGPVGQPTQIEGLWASPADPELTLDASTTATVLRAWWDAHADALQRSDESALRQLTTDGARDHHLIDCGPCSPWAGELLEETVTFSAPTDRGYPASFLAQVRMRYTLPRRTNPGPFERQGFVAFTRTSSDAPWRAAVVVSFDGDRAVPSASGEGPVYPLLGELDEEALPGLFVDVAEAFEVGKHEGRVPDGLPFPAGPDTLIGHEIAHVHESYLESVARGWTDQTDYRSAVDEDGLHVFATGFGELVCSTIRWTTRIEPAAGEVIEHDGVSEPFRWRLAAGRYARIERVGVRQVCFLLRGLWNEPDVVATEAGVTGYRAEPPD